MSEKFSDSMTEALRRMAEKNGFVTQEQYRPKLLLDALGGVRGIIESSLPVALFVIVYTISKSLHISLAISLSAALLILIGRLITKRSAAPAIGGFFALGVSALISLYTGKGVDNFVIGLVVNAVWTLIFVVSALIRWPFAGLLFGAVKRDMSWRKDPRKMRVFQLITLLFAATFTLRLAVQFPMYLAENVELLGTFKLLMGAPLSALALLASWLIYRKYYPKDSAKNKE